MLERTWARTLLVVAMLGVSGAAAAQSEPQPNDKQQERADERKAQRQTERGQNERAPTDNWPASYRKASQIIGLRVDDHDGKKIGDVRNLAINTENGHIRYAIIENAGKFYAAPMPVLKIAGKPERASIDTTAERMKDAPPFNPQGWNTIGDAKWGADVFSFYGISRDPALDRERPDFVPAVAIVGGQVEARQGEKLGTIRDIVVDTDRSNVLYAVIGFGNDNKLFAAPWAALSVSDLGRKIVLRGVEREDLAKGAGFASDRWPIAKDFTWGKDTNFDSRPPNWLYGLKAQGGAGGNGGNGTGPGDGDGGVMGGWQTNSKYGQLFDRKTIERVTGTIVRSENLAPMPAMDPGAAIIVKAADGKNVVVHLGPEWFIRHQQGQFRQGAEVDVTGSRVTIDGKHVIMATQLRINGRTMTLREDTGVPVWDAWQERRRN